MSKREDVQEKKQDTATCELSALLDKMLDFYRKRDWEQFHSPKNLVMNLAAEVGELADLFRWLTDQQSYSLDPKTYDKVRDEIGDVFPAILYLAYKLGIDPVEASSKKLVKLEKKYPMETCRGKPFKHTHYSEKTL